MSRVAKGDHPCRKMRRITTVLLHKKHLTPSDRQIGDKCARMSIRTLGFWVLLATLFLFQNAASAFDTVVLDPGHGGHDRGASIGYVFEKHLALDTARRVEQLLKQAGLKVIMTRSRDVFIPLPGRAEAGNRYGNAIFVSLHYNYNRGGSGSGVETYYKHSSSYSLAAYIQAYLVQRTRMINRGVKSASFHVIRNTTRNPAVLVECGFVSNSIERSRMMTGEFRARIAEGVAQGIVAYKKAR
jgi:N-acetylmuramoyl-L-alanine amidase